MQVASVLGVDKALDGPMRGLEPTREARNAWTAHRTGVHAVARQAEEVMPEENSDWFLTMEGHDFELHDAV